MYYQIITGTPQREMSGWGFHIKLWPEWKELVAKSDLNQQKANHAIKTLGSGWLDACGYDRMTDPDADLLDALKAEREGKPLKLGPKAHRVYEPGMAIQVSWGVWGLEHITGPGNACGLDISDGIDAPINGMVLLPHNIDSMRQAYLLQLIFNWFGDAIVLGEELRRMNQRLR